jgi:signal transduction histidine kinase
MVTAVSDAATAVRAMQLGAYDYVIKPLDLETITAAVERALERRRLLAENARFRRELDENISGLARGVAHELRNPLAIISSAAQWGLKRVRDDADLSETLEAITSNVRVADRIIRELSDFAASRTLKVRAESVEPVIDAAIELVRPELVRAHIDLERERDPDAPTLLIDPDRLQQTFVNILLNTVHAVGDGGRIEIRSRCDGDAHACITVEDDGPGIRLEDRERIFDPFVSLRAGGTGLGLAFCRRIVRAHAGTVTATAGPLGGARFTLRLPVPSAEALAAVAQWNARPISMERLP